MDSRPAEQPGEDPSDAELLRAHVDGDPDAFATLVRRHRDRLWAVALRTTGHPEDAADALQDALVSAYRRAGSFRGEAAVTTWLHRVTVNACLDRLRRNSTRRADPLPDDLAEREQPDGGGGSGTSGAIDPVGAVLAAEIRDRVHAALRELPQDQRTCLVLVDLEGWSVAEVAAHLEVPVGTVKSRCHRGRARLAGLLPDLVSGDTATEVPPPGTTPSSPASHHRGATPPPRDSAPSNPTTTPDGGDPRA